MSYFLAASLVQLRNEVNKRWPNRSKVSDGWIGDTAHSARISDHNPDWRAPGKRRGVVRALDITTSGIDVDLLLKHTTNDSRVRYVIYNWRIYTHSKGWQKYNGPNGHTTHVHISISSASNGKHEYDTKKWFGSAGGVANPQPKKKVSTSNKKKSNTKTKSGAVGGEWPKSPLYVDGKFQSISKRAYQRLLAPQGVGNYRGRIDADFSTLSVKAEQRWLKKLGFYKGRIDGIRGPMTIRALQSFLKSKGYYKGRIDGQFGPMTVKALQTYLNSQRKYY